MNEIKTMRDALIEKIYELLESGEKNIIFVSDDFGAPALDRLREKFKNNFINVGIAEQNLINISAGLGLEGFTVFSYGIAPFLTMRCYEQIKNNLALMSEWKKINVNLIGVGAGISYDLSGPSHHSIEDISIMRVLPNFVVFSPSDYVLAEKFVEWSLYVKKPKYARLDSKPLPRIYNSEINFEKGFSEIKEGEKVCLISTGYMTHKALNVAEKCEKLGINVSVLDIFLLKPLDSHALWNKIKKFDTIITLEEGFVNKGGLDTLILNILKEKNSDIQLINLGFGDKFVIENGDREYLHKLNGMSVEDIIKLVEKTWEKKQGF